MAATLLRKPTVISRGSKLVVGVPNQCQPICGAPLGAQRVRFTNSSFAILFVRTPNGIRRMPIEDCGDYWRARPDLTQAATVRRPRTVAWLPGADVTKAIRLNPHLAR